MTAMIDHGRLAAMAQGSGATLASILADFRRGNAEDAAALHLAAGTEDMAEVGRLAHRVKGAAMMLGAVPFAETCSLVAMASRAENLTAVSAALVFFDRQMKELNVYLDSPVGSQPAAAPLAAAVPSEIPRSFCSGLNFMVVEDHPFQRRIIMSYLLGRGALEVRDFGDAESALEALNAGTCLADIMVLDLSMPGMDGMDLIRSLSGTTHSVALILNSAMSPNLLASIVQIAKRYRVALLGAVGKPLTDANLAPLVALYRSGVTERS